MYVCVCQKASSLVSFRSHRTAFFLVIHWYVSGQSFVQLLYNPDTIAPTNPDACTERTACAHVCRILHRDIKPGNFMLLTDSETAHVKAIDFGAFFLCLQPCQTLILEVFILSDMGTLGVWGMWLRIYSQLPFPQQNPKWYTTALFFTKRTLLVLLQQWQLAQPKPGCSDDAIPCGWDWAQPNPHPIGSVHFMCKRRPESPPHRQALSVLSVVNCSHRGLCLNVLPWHLIWVHRM
jgi:hypothetical protein